MNRSQKQQKTDNQLSLLHLIRREGQVSQIALSSGTGYQPSTISNLIRELKDLGLVRVSGKALSGRSGGKRADLLSLVSSYGVYAGIDIRNAGLVAVLTDFSGTVLEQETLAFRPSDVKSLFEVLSGKIRATMAAWGERYRGTGISVSSIVSNDGAVLPSADFDWRIPDFRIRLGELFPSHPLVIENDANCAALYADHFFRNAYKNFVALLLYPSRGSLGSGIILDGKLYRGAHGAAGELWKTGTDDEFSVENISRHAVAAATLLDCEAIILSGEMESDEEREHLQRITARIDTMSGDFALGIIPDRNIAVTGAAFLAVQVSIKRLLEREGGIL